LHLKHHTIPVKLRLIIFPWGASCCVILPHSLSLPAIATETCYFIFSLSQLVSTPTGHLQVEYNIIYTSVTLNGTSDVQLMLYSS
jgi:hypothetical protein